MSSPDEALDRFLDSLSRGGGEPSPDLDAAAMQAAERLFRRSRQTAPSTSFVSHLEETLMARQQTAVPGAIDRPSRSILSDSRDAGRAGPAKRSIWAARVAIAAAFAVLLVAALASLDRSGGNEQTPVAALIQTSPAVYPPAADCVYSQSAMATFLAGAQARVGTYLINSTPWVLRHPPGQFAYQERMIPESALPTGAAPDEATRAAIERAVRREVACRNAAAFQWPAILTRFGSAATPGAAAATPTGGTATSQGITPIPVPDILRMSVLSDGRVFVLLSSDLFGERLKTWLIFSKVQSDWFAGDSGQTASDEWIAYGYHGPLMGAPVIHLNDTYMWPLELKTHANQLVNVSIINDGQKTRTFSMPQLNIRITLESQQQTVIPLTLAPNGYWFTEDFDPESQTKNGGYIWAVDPAADLATAQP